VTRNSFVAVVFGAKCEYEKVLFVCCSIFFFLLHSATGAAVVPTEQVQFNFIIFYCDLVLIVFHFNGNTHDLKYITLLINAVVIFLTETNKR